MEVVLQNSTLGVEEVAAVLDLRTFEYPDWRFSLESVVDELQMLLMPIYIGEVLEVAS